MSGTYPTTPTPATLNLKSIQPLLVSTSHSLKRQVRSRGGQRWGFSLTYPPLFRSALAPLQAFLLAQRGGYETFTFYHPLQRVPQGTWAGTPLVKGGSQTGRSIACDGFNIGATVKAGDWVKFNGHAKVYQVTADASGSLGGELTLSIEPAVVTSPADNEPLVFSSVPFTCALASESIEIGVVPGKLYSLSVELLEVP